MSWRSWSQTAVYTTIFRIICYLFIILVVFWAGMLLGFRKANTAYHWGGAYQGAFGRTSSSSAFQDMLGFDFTNGDGAAGEVVAIQGEHLVVKTRDGIEKGITCTDDTHIRYRRTDVAFADVHVGDQVVVFGEPDATGNLNARLVRIMSN